MKIIKHTCTLDCADCCTFEVYVKDNNITKILGDKNHPYTKGLICKKGLSHLDRLKHKERIQEPLLKVNGVWEKISFDKALEIMSERLRRYCNEYSSKSILYYEQYGNGSVLKSIGEIFFNFLGGVSKSKGGPCWSAGIKAQELDFGEVKSHSLEDMLNSKSIIVWGKNPANTSIHTLQMIKKAKDRGSKVIVIDPICTDTTKFAHKYIRVNPGQDDVLALAIGKIIVEDYLYDKDYIDSYVQGFKEYSEYLYSLDLITLCNECGVKEKEVRELVNLYTNKYSTILLGYGIQKYKNGGRTIRLIDSLAAITGQIGFSGGGVNYANKVYPSIINTDPYFSEEQGNNRGYYTAHISDFINDSIKGETFYKNNIYTKDLIDSNADDICKMNIPIKMAVIVKSNLLTQLPNINALEKSFSKIDFKVCFEMFMTDTAKCCDLIIPCTNTLESEDLIFSSMSNPYISFNKKIIEPKDPLMDEYYFFMELAKRLNISNYPKVSKKEYLSKVISPLKEFNPEISLEWLINNPYTIHNSIAWEDKKFLTKSGNFELITLKNIENTNLNTSINKSKNQFRLLTNHHRDSLSSQHFMDTEGISKAYINMKMAKEINISNGEVVKIKSANGIITVKIQIDEATCDYVVMMYAGWWKKHGNPNALTISKNSDVGGQIIYNDTFVEILK